MEETTSYYYTLKDMFGLGTEKTYLVNFPYIKAAFSDSAKNSLTYLFSDDAVELVNPLLHRWSNDHIAIVVSDEELELKGTDVMTTIWEYTCPIWIKLDDILRTKIDEYKRLKTFLDSTITNDATTTSVNRSNDTPTSEGNYSANEYTTNISQNTTTSTSSVNSLEDYDAKVSRIRNIQLEIINEMKEFEIWI